MASFEMVLICAGVFLAGALIGFGIATIYSSNQILTLWDEKTSLMKELAETRAQKATLQDTVNKMAKPAVIEISDSTVGDGVKFGGF